jgi:glycosyltransferase involved in cell wall biosynthesis|tara:strand:+ start:851 stop:1780 length:930 start_codon:yes stop_codon:yes gene_type:complete
MNKIIPHISFVSPVYKAEHILEKLVIEIEKVMKVIDQPFEVILVDDRSPDNGWEVIKKLAKDYESVKSIRLSKNFGQHPAIMAGLSKTNGEWVVVMDCDLQDQPKEVLKLYDKAMEGYDVVLAKRRQRKDSFLKKMTSLFFAKIYGFFTNTAYDNEVANYGIYNQKVIRSILQVSDYIKFFPLFVNFVGFNSTAIVVEHSDRAEGETSYSLSKLLSLAFNTIISFSNKPLKLFVKFGLIISLVSFILGLYNIYLSFTGKIEVLGYSSIIISIWLLSGIIITTIGVSGIYIGKIFDQVKSRPVYIIDEII